MNPTNTRKRLELRLEPQTVHLQRRKTKAVHDVGEVIPIQISQGKVTLRVIATDPVTGQTPAGVVRVGGRSFPLNQSFEYELKAEFNEKTRNWIREPIWVESENYPNEEVEYDVQVDD